MNCSLAVGQGIVLLLNTMLTKAAGEETSVLHTEFMFTLIQIIITIIIITTTIIII